MGNIKVVILHCLEEGILQYNIITIKNKVKVDYFYLNIC